MTVGFWQRRRIPLAALMLIRQPVRLLVALAGISFAGILMFMQLGFRDGLFDASVTVHRRFDADLVLISPRSTSSVRMAGFPKRRLIQTMADAEFRGRVVAVWFIVMWGGSVVGSLLTGLIIELAGTGAAMLVGGLTMLGAYGFATRGARVSAVEELRS